MKYEFECHYCGEFFCEDELVPGVEPPCHYCGSTDVSLVENNDEE